MLIKLPESVRWAWTVGKFEKANQVIKDMTEVNKIQVPEEFILDHASYDLENEQEKTKPIGMTSLIACKALRGRLMVMGLNWVRDHWLSVHIQFETLKVIPFESQW